METISAEATIPPYIDTKTPLLKWYGYNTVIFIASLAMAYVASLLIEYELARLRTPEASFIQTPLWFDLSASSIVLLLGIANIGVLLFVLLRHLWLRKWMLVTTVIGWMILASLALVLRDSFLPVLIPSF